MIYCFRHTQGYSAAESRVLLPPPYPLPLCEGGGGVAKHTKTVSYPLSPSRKEMPMKEGIKETVF